MIIKNGKHYYEEADLRNYGRGYWDGRFKGYVEGESLPTVYILGFTHGEADYLEYDADFEPDPVYDDLDVVEQIRNHPLGDSLTNNN